MLAGCWADRLRPYADRDDVIVLGLPRGGVPLAGVVAEAMGAPMDALIVRKVGVPGHEEVVVSAIGPTGL